MIMNVVMANTLMVTGLVSKAFSTKHCILRLCSLSMVLYSTNFLLSAFVWKEDHGDLPLDTLQLWDCFDYNLTVIEKPMLSRCEFFGKDRQMHPGEYMFTVDTCHSESSTLDTGFSQHDPEHKSFNILRLDNGQFAAQPNNRIIWKDMSLIPEDTQMPDFKVCTQNYRVENSDKWTVGHTEEWMYKTEDGS